MMLPRPFTAALALAWIAAPSLAQSQQDVDRQLEEIEDMPTRICEVTRIVTQELTDIEGENQALLEKLGEADDRAAREKARADQLESELSRLLGGQPAASTEPAPADAPPAAEPGLKRLTIPPREVNALGLVVSSDRPLAEHVAGDELRVVPLPELAASGGTLRIENRGPEVAFIHDDPMGGRVTLATLKLNDGRLTWTWAGSVSSRVRDTLEALDAWLATGVVEVLAGGQVVERWQVAPTTIDLRAVKGRQTAAAPAWARGLPLQIEPHTDGTGWSLDARGEHAVRLVSRDAILLLEWRAERGELAVTLERVPGGVAADLERQTQAWERDLARLRKEGGSARDIARIEEEIATLQRRRAALQDAGAGVIGNTTRCLVSMMAPNGVACLLFDVHE